MTPHRLLALAAALAAGLPAAAQPPKGQPPKGRPPKAAGKEDEGAALRRFAEQTRSLLLPMPSDPPGRSGVSLVSLGVRETTTDAQLRQLAGLSPKRLGGLSLVNCPALTEATFAKFGPMPQLAELGLPPHLTDTAYAKLADRFPGLVKFSNQNADSDPGKLTATGLDEVCRLARLTELKLAADLSDDCWAGLAKLTALDSLDVRSKTATGKGLGRLAACTELTSLTLGCPLTAAGEFGGLTGLEYLNLVDGPVGPAALAGLDALPKLRMVTLLRVSVDAPLLEALAKAPALKSLDVRRTTLTPKAVAGLKALKRLDSLNLTFATASPAVVAELQTALPATVVFPPTTPAP